MLTKYEERCLSNRWVVFNDAITHNWYKVNTLDGKVWRYSVHSMDSLVELVHNATSGKFFFGNDCIYFEQEKDAVLFQLKYTNKI